MFREDHLNRLVEQFGRTVERVLPLIHKQAFDEANREIAVAEQALGVPPGLDQIDARSAAMVLGNADKVVLLARLIELRAEAADARGAAADAARHRARALALLDCARPLELTRDAEALRGRLADRDRAS